MTPKEKAILLFETFLSKVGSNCENDNDCYRKECRYKNRIVCGVDLFTAKQCALVAVDEILNYIYRMNNDFNLNLSSSDWIKVKQEIEKLC